MQTSLSSFDVPPASMSIFEILSIVASILVYRLYLVALLPRKLKNGNPDQGLTQLQRMGVGLCVSAAAMVVAGAVEMERLKHLKNECVECMGSNFISILWQIPQYALIGVSEVFMYVSQLEFFNSQTPDDLKSFRRALYVGSMSVGSYMSRLLQYVCKFSLESPRATCAPVCLCSQCAPLPCKSPSVCKCLPLLPL